MEDHDYKVHFEPADDATPEQALALAILETYPEDLFLARKQYGGWEFQKYVRHLLKQAHSVWTAEVCSMGGVDHAWFTQEMRALAFRLGYAGDGIFPPVQ